MDNPTITKADLLPCLVESCASNPSVEYHCGAHYVECQTCGDQGPIHWLEADAVNGWNTRRSASSGAAHSGEDALRVALAEAYRKGASDVHNYWTNNPGEAPRGDPEFGKAASDYAAAALDLFDSSARATLSPSEGGEHAPEPTNEQS